MLAAKAEHRHTRHIRMMNVSRKNSAKIPRIFARRAATLLVRQKFDAIDVFENFRRRAAACDSPPLRQLKILQLRRFPFAKQLHHLRNLPPINLRQRESQLFLKRLLQNAKIPVLAKHQRHNEPMIPRAHLPIGTVIAEKCPIAPLRHIRRRPSRRRDRARVIVRRRMPQIFRREQIAAPHRLAHRPTSPPYMMICSPDGKIARHKFVFRRNVRQQRVLAARKRNRVALPQRPQRHQNIVSRIKLKHRVLHPSPFPWRSMECNEYRNWFKSCQMTSRRTWRYADVANSRCRNVSHFRQRSRISRLAKCRST